MISSSRKFPLRSDRRILRQGQRLRGKFMEIFTQASPLPRIAVIVGKNVSLLSTGRNLVKRRITAALLARLPDLRVDVVVRALPQSNQATYEQLETELRELLPKT